MAHALDTHCTDTGATGYFPVLQQIPNLTHTDLAYIR